MTHAAESTHFYTQDGEPAYEVPNASKGGMRPTTVRDAKKLGYLPSVTTIIRCADRPALTNWMVDQGILAALTLPRNAGELEADWLKRVKQDSREQARKAAERGTAIHAAIQGHYEGQQPSEADWPYVQGAMKAVGLGTWEPERSFAHKLGFGGKVDLSNDGMVLDFKTKEFGHDDDLRTWDEHAMQLAAYRQGLNVQKAKCAICYVSVNNPGVARMIEIPEDELERGWNCFMALLLFWQAKNRYPAPQSA